MKQMEKFTYNGLLLITNSIFLAIIYWIWLTFRYSSVIVAMNSSVNGFYVTRMFSLHS